VRRWASGVLLFLLLSLIMLRAERSKLGRGAVAPGGVAMVLDVPLGA
jgi:hypothetical protein